MDALNCHLKEPVSLNRFRPKYMLLSFAYIFYIYFLHAVLHFLHLFLVLLSSLTGTSQIR